MRIGEKLLLISLLGFAFAVLPFGYGAQASTIESNQRITMSTNQWNELKMLLMEQENDLMNLKEKLKNLKSNSIEQQQELERLSIELRAVRKSLMTARLSLNAAKNALEESKKSLQMLKQEINKIEHKERVTRRQRDTWAAIAGAALVWGAFK